MKNLLATVGLFGFVVLSFTAGANTPTGPTVKTAPAPTAIPVVKAAPKFDVLPGYPTTVAAKEKDAVTTLCARRDVAPIYWAGCCRTSNRYCDELRSEKANPCIREVGERWTPFTMNDRSIICCPDGAVPTGLRPPHRLCTRPADIAPYRASIENPQMGVSAASMGPLLFLLRQGVARGGGVLQCYEGVTIRCAGLHNVDTTNLVGRGNLNSACRGNIAMKQCIETGYLACLGGNFLLSIP